MRKMLLTVLLMSSFLLSSCALTVPNIEVCHDRYHIARCTETLSGNVRHPRRWNEERVGRFSVSASDWKKIKKFIKKACQKAECNNEKIKASINNIESR